MGSGTLGEDLAVLIFSLVIVTGFCLRAFVVVSTGLAALPPFLGSVTLLS